MVKDPSGGNQNDREMEWKKISSECKRFTALLAMGSTVCKKLLTSIPQKCRHLASANDDSVAAGSATLVVVVGLGRAVGSVRVSAARP
ncbi:uncharacterized protein MYCGRDRAFT_102067, partial [Zymoseptoria tritici IPO323]